VLVYLAGPIAGLGYAGATDWREFATCVLSDEDIVALSPMRGKQYLQDVGVIGSSHTRPDRPLSTPQAIVARDYFDVKRADLILVNLLGATRVSIGTMFEAAWCLHWRKPLVLVMEESGNPHDHWFVHQAAGFRVSRLTDGLELTTAILKP
jgi:nucleoside 2-deoxyribosyltransferase